MHRSLLRLAVAGGAFDRVADADVGAAAANVPRHRRVDIGIIGMRRRGQERRRRHDLAGLAIAALDHFQIQPSFLNPRADGRRADAFDRGNSAIADRADWQQTRAHRLAVEMHSAGAALRDAATKFGAGHAEHVAHTQSSGMSPGASKVRFSPLISRFMVTSLRPWGSSVRDDGDAGKP